MKLIQGLASNEAWSHPRSGPTGVGFASDKTSFEFLDVCEILAVLILRVTRHLFHPGSSILRALDSLEALPHSAFDHSRMLS